MSDTYTTLMLALLEQEDNKLTIDSNVTPSAIRKGLMKALDEYNTMQSLLFMEETDLNNITIVAAPVGWTIQLYSEASSKEHLLRKTNKFSFKVLSASTSEDQEVTTNDITRK